jgi:hypothetical protein
MKRIQIVGLCLMAVFALSAGAASSASAGDLLAQVKGGSIVGTTFLSSVTLPQLITHNGSTIHCKDATNHGLFLSATLGNVLIRFLGCTTSGLKCNSLNAGTEEIHLPLSTLFHLGLAHLDSTHRSIPAAVLLLGKTILLNCGSELAIINVKGNVIGALQTAAGAQQPLNTPFSTINWNFQQTANGLQHLRLILMPGSTTPTTFDLESKTNAGLFELASEVANAKLDGFKNSAGATVEPELVEP